MALIFFEQFHIHEYFQRIEDTVTNKFIPAISEGHTVKLMSLLTRFGGLAIPLIKNIATIRLYRLKDVSQRN